MTCAPLIYNLFPLLAGPFEQWEPHLARAQGMGFNHVYFNPVSYPGFSGSLYAVKNYYGFHPLLAPDGDDRAADAFAAVLKTMHGMGLVPIMDLVINHTAIDCPLTREHPGWYRHDDAGKIAHPGAKDGDKWVEWGDLASIDNAHTGDRDGLWAFWDQLIAHHQQLGVKGFRCDAAYHVPTDLWRHLIGRAKDRDPEACFFAETLGCEIEDVIALAGAGFTFAFNSAKWWDYEAPWCLAQHEASRHHIPTISFPETHDTSRLAADCHGHTGAILARYAFSALFATGVMMPMGFEFGATRPLHVVSTRPDQWEVNQDLVEAVSEINRLKTEHPVFCQEGPVSMEPNSPPHVTDLVRKSTDSHGSALLRIGRSPDAPVPESPPPGWERNITPNALTSHGAAMAIYLRKT